MNLRGIKSKFTSPDDLMKTRYNFQRYGLHFFNGLIFFSLFMALSFTTVKESCQGKLFYKAGKKTFDIELKYAHFITGPDTFDPKKKIRRLIFTANPLDEKIKSCKVLNCVDQYIEGIQVDLDAAPRLLYWVSVNGQLVQYSGTSVNETLYLSTDSQEQLAGTLKFDHSAAGGPVVDVTFNAAMMKNFDQAR